MSSDEARPVSLLWDRRREPAILAGLASGGGDLGGIVVAFQHAAGAASPPASGRLCLGRTVVAAAKAVPPW
jgi:hypothetical protein